MGWPVLGASGRSAIAVAMDCFVSGLLGLFAAVAAPMVAFGLLDAPVLVPSLRERAHTTICQYYTGVAMGHAASASYLACRQRERDLRSPKAGEAHESRGPQRI